ncbi:MAG: helix-turn-helix transcriptional regulator [Caulobacterales bacterium]|nr:helix-turn-helix transcriptional regulator [Caulobacterales bacterium]
MDRRVAKTLALLEQAHLSLVVENGYDAVTVEDICARANVGRSTFYAHFTGKDDLHRRGVEALRHELKVHGAAASGDGDTPGLAFSLPMFEHARGHLDLYRALTGSRAGVVAMESIRQVLCEAVRAELSSVAATGSATAPPRELLVQHVVGAYLGILTWWLDAGAQIPPREMDAMFRRLMGEGLPPT